jgi:hypothetical protein
MDMLDGSEAPARHGYHAISHAPRPRLQWRIRPHRPDQNDNRRQLPLLCFKA